MIYATTKPDVSIGADPELFLFDGTNPVSAHDIVPGTKTSPMKVPRGAIQVDGVAAEFNIEPAKTQKEFLKNIKHVRHILSHLVAAKNAKLQLTAIPTVYFPEAYFNALPTETKALGCEPDYDAYTGRPNPKPTTQLPMRTGSGHIHIGWAGCDPDRHDYDEIVRLIVRELDFVIFRQSMVWDQDTERRSLYGKPGAFRYKPYGLEYRVLSNRWLDSDAIMRFIFDAAKNVTSRVLMGEQFEKNFKDQTSYDNYLMVRRLPMVSEYLGITPDE
jgi:hypothetical protein